MVSVYNEQLLTQNKIRTSILIRLQHLKELSMVVLVHPGRCNDVWNVIFNRTTHVLSWFSTLCACTFVFGECNDI